jgi:hypothetical protein
VQFEAALNLVWLVLGVLALASTSRSRLYGSGDYKVRYAAHSPVWLHVCGVALIVAALFPYISATDDVLRIEHMNVEQLPGHHQETGKKAGIDGLMRLYEAMDTPVVGAVRELAFILFFVGMVVVLVRQHVERSMPLQSGRSPPDYFSPILNTR